MPLKFKNYSPRAKWWDYSSASTYFITICTKDKQAFFGTNSNGINHLNKIGKMVAEEWLRSPEVRPDMNITLGKFVVMPDHFHAIIHIGNNPFNKSPASPTIDENGVVSYNSFSPQSKNLASTIRGFKASVTVRAREINPHFQWRKLYHDVIVKSHGQLVRTEIYIENNPKNYKSGNS